MSDYDAVIVGGRVAGAATALLLSRAGLRVAVVERSRVGSDTVSTHALMRAGVLQLSRWGVLPDLVAAGTPAVRRIAFHYADGDSAQVSLRPSPGVDALYAPRRHLLDRVLIDAAAASGAHVLHETPVVGLLRDDDGRVLGVRTLGADAREVPIRAPLTVGADGVGSFVARSVEAPFVSRGRAASAVLYRYVEEVPSEGYVWAYGDGAAAGLIPTNDGETCVFVATTPSRMRALRRDGAEGAFERLLDAVPAPMSDTVRAGGAVGRLHGWRGTPGQVRRSVGPGWALVGDAGYFKDPITTHGLTDALRDAELLSDAVVADLGGAPPGVALAGYQDTRDLLSRALVEVTESVCRYDWGADRIRTLLRAVSSAMSDEMDYLSEAARQRAASPARPTAEYASAASVLSRR
jgi:flavin-dependent dehydrogenase